MAERSVYVRLIADVGQFKAAMGGASKATDDLGKSTERTTQKSQSAFARMGESARKNRQEWTQVGGALAVAGGAVTAFGVAALKTGIAYNQLQQTTRAALTTILGSAEAANAQMDKLDEFARSSPFAKQVFITAQQQLLGFGVEAEKVLPTLDAIQNAVAATGGSNQDIAELARIFAQVEGAGKMTAETLNQFGIRGVDAATIIGEQMGKTGGQIRDEITAGSLDAGAAMDALVVGMDERFGGAADNVKNTFAGALDRVKAAWRDFSASLAEPLVSAGGGGFAVELLNTLADLMRWFEGLPDPIKNTTAALGLLGGVAALGAGSFLLLLPRILDTKDALSRLSTEAPKAAGAMRGLGRAFAALAAAAVTIEVIKSVQDAVIDAGPPVEALTRDLLDLANTSGFPGVTNDLNDLADSINRITNPDWGTGASDWLGNVVGVKAGSLKEAENDITALDEALTGLVNSGRADLAAEALADLAAEAGLTDEEFAALLPLLDAYNAALLNSETAARIGSEGVLLVGQSAEESKAAIDALEAAVKGLNDAFSDEASAIQFEQSLDDLTGMFKELTTAKKDETKAEKDRRLAQLDSARSLDITTEAGRRAKTLLMGLISDGAENAQMILEQTGNTELYAETLREQRTRIMDTAEALGISKKEAKDLIAEYDQIPAEIGTDIKVDVEDSRPDWLKRLMRDGRQTLPLVLKPQLLDQAESFGYRTPGAMGPGRVEGRADGGWIDGPGGPTDDAILIAASNGEYVIRAAAAARLGTERLDWINQTGTLPAFASGGMVGTPSYATGGSVSAVPIGEIVRAWREAMGVIERAELDRIRTQRADQDRNVRGATNAVARAELKIREAAASVRDARRGVDEAREGVHDAKRGVREAQNSVAEVRRDNLERLRDARERIHDAKPGKARDRARRDLEKVERDNIRREAEAKKRVAEAEKRVTEAAKRVDEAWKRVREAEKAVVWANKRKGESEDKLAQAQRERLKAVRDLTQAEKDYALGQQRPTRILAAALNQNIKDQDKFLADLEALANRGHGEFARQVLAAGDEALAADAVRSTDAQVARLGSQMRWQQSRMDRLDALPTVFTILGELAKKPGSTIAEMAFSTGIGYVELMQAAATAKDLIKSAGGSTFLAELKRNGFAFGGLIGGNSPHARADDQIIAATSGEYVMQRSSVDKYGTAFMHAVNSGQLRPATTGSSVMASVRVEVAPVFHGITDTAAIVGELQTVADKAVAAGFRELGRST